MVSQRRTLSLAFLLSAACACAGSGRGGSASPNVGATPPAAAAEQPSVSRSMVLKGTFKPILQSTGAVRAVEKIRVSGSVTVISTGVANSHTRVRLDISLNLTNEQLPWAIVPGACGNGAIAVAAVSKFGAIDLGSSGHGILETDLAISLTPGAPYHVEVYQAGQTLDAVLACAVLTRVE